MVDVSTRGFVVVVLSIFLLISPGGWFFAIMVALLFALVGWALIGVANEIGTLRSEISTLNREIKRLKKELEEAG
ncbi:hypothetical protein [Thermococcus thioreducens]|uniref:Uncharacterized protein n=1 Tax=Thermococcus thioreducens TaxID=277988 RepID=A0A0Q2RE11_9EURY|nr:hypothetical protein [Thermococcus thioreducens]ASJ12929.1 hypothetical protein A3L14_08540 [Thermococcus thioreducens]KQH82198.1 hypothetical protein AMR53_07095 [Thermococcus thioreducens]SEV83308.1 hypothetical protein SAMN05216170_0236 [Thermococcus thioreducens]